MTLMETVIAISIIAVTVPLIFAALGASSQSRRYSGDETRAAWIAEQISDDVARAWRGEGMYLEGTLAYPDFGQGGDAVVLGFDEEGVFSRTLAAGAWESGVQGGNEVYLVKVVGQGYAPPDLPGETLSKVSVEVSAPAVAPLSERKNLGFHTLKTQYDD